MVKQAIKEGRSGEKRGNVTNNNLIVTSREEIMNMIENQSKEVDEEEQKEKSDNE